MVTNKRGALYFKYLSMEQVEAADSKDREQDVSTDAENTEEGIIKVVGEKEVTRGDEETKENVETVQSEIGGEEEENERVKGHSVVENAAPTDAVEDKVDPTAHHPLSLSWCFGFNHTLPVHNISNDNRKMVFYVSGHTGVLYDCERNRQHLLQGHGNPITCTAVSGDRRWLVTADEGHDPLATVWDSFSGVPVRTFFEGLGPGCVAVALSHDAHYLATLTSQPTSQVLSIWQWTVDSDQPICHVTLTDHTHQSHLTFHPTDHSQLLSTGESQVAFFTWDGVKLHMSSQQVTDKDFNKPVGVFSQSVFIPDSHQLALTGTSLGCGVVWGPLKKGSQGKKPLKLMKLNDDPITTITTTGSLLVVGDDAGRVKFLSSELKLLHWYEGVLGSGPLVSISFAHTSSVRKGTLEHTASLEGSHYPLQSTLDTPPLVVPDFTLSSLSSSLIHVTANGTITDVLFRGHSAAVHGLSPHPSLPRIAMAGYSTLLQLWDYHSKEVLVSRDFEEPNYIQCVSFDPRGEFIGVGFTSGVVLVVDSLSLQDASPLFRYSRHTVSHISFSHDSHYMATADRDHCVSVYTARQLVKEEEEEEEEEELVVTWEFMAKYRSHYEEIESILFGVGLDSDSPRLLSLGQDRMLVEYDLEHSTTDNLCILSSDRIEQSAVPTTLTWYPPVSKESFLLLCNNQYKLKLINSTTKMCRKTLLGPTFGSPLERLEVLSSPVKYSESGQEIRRYAAFHTYDRVGLLLLPHDGNPHNSQSLVAHPTGVSAMAVSHDGRYVFTAGGQDCTVNMWTANTQALEAASQLGGEDLEPFYELLEGGRYGEFYAEMEQFFYYAQIKSQGVKTCSTRQVSTTVPVDQVPDLMRALGYYPSEQDIDDILNEIKFSEYVETGAYVTEIDLPTFIKLYINHRPAFGLSPVDLLQAFSSLSVDGEGPGCTVDRATLLAMLQENGEHMCEGELVEALMTLLGHCHDPESDGAFSQDTHTALEQGLPQAISAAHFAENLLHLTLQTSPPQS